MILNVYDDNIKNNSSSNKNKDNNNNNNNNNSNNNYMTSVLKFLNYLKKIALRLEYVCLLQFFIWSYFRSKKQYLMPSANCVISVKWLCKNQNSK